MPRRERPLADGDSPLLRLAADLRRLRADAGGLSYRELAQRAHCSSTALSDAAGGRRLPGLAIVLAYVNACGGDEAVWRQRWHDVAAESARAQLAGDEATDAGPTPYRGLAPLGAEDADLLFGREVVVNRLASRVAGQRFVALFGASGEGKTSVLRAGLMAMANAGVLGNGRPWPAVVFKPGPHPMEECAAVLASMTGRTAGLLRAELRADPLNLHRLVRQALVDEPPEVDVLMVVDQFEEVFTLCRDEAERSEFITMLLSSVQAVNSRTRVVLGVRSDFYPHCAGQPRLVEAIDDAQVTLGAMSTDELTRAITGPARRVGLSVEATLVSAVVADANGRSGVLPLVSHALHETWRRRRGTTLTLAGYHAAGGIRSALTHTAEATYTGLTEHQQDLVRQLLPRLTALGEGTEDTKRRVRRDELGHEDPDLDTVLGALAAARMLTLGDDTVEITHEALFGAWPRLRQWLDDDREGLRVHRQLTEAATIWADLDKDPGALYRGARLSSTSEWLRRAAPALTAREREFVRASTTATTRQRRASRSALAVLAALALLATAAAGIALDHRDKAELQRRIALSRHLAAQAAVPARNLDAPARTAIEAYRTHPTVEAKGAVLSQAARWAGSARVPLTGFSGSFALSPDGSLLAHPEADHVVVRRTDTTDHVLDLRTTDSRSPSGALAFSPDGRYLVVAYIGGAIGVWAAATWEPVRVVKTTSTTAFDLAFSPDGRTLVSTAARGRGFVTVWNTETWSETATLATGAVGHTAVAIGADNRTVATVGHQGVELWDLGTRTLIAELATEEGTMSDLAFLPGGTLLAVASDRGAVTLWDTASHARVATPARHQGGALSVSFDHDGTTLTSTGGDNRVVLWDVGRRAEVGEVVVEEPSDPDFGKRPGLQTAALAPDGTLVAANFRNILLWSAGRLPRDDGTAIDSLKFASDNGRLFSMDDSGSITTWSTGEYLRPVNRQTPFTEVVPPTGSVSSRGEAVILVRPDQAVSYRLTRGGMLVPDVTGLGPIDPRRAILAFEVQHLPESPGSIALGPDLQHGPNQSEPTTGNQEYSVPGYGRLPNGLTIAPAAAAMSAAPRRNALAEGANISISGLGDGSGFAQLTGHSGSVTALAFSPDGTVLASGGTDRTVILWDTTTGREITRLSGHSGSITALAFSPDGRVLATGSSDTTTILWRTATGEHDATLSGPTGSVMHVTWSPDGQSLATAHDAGVISVWPTDVDKAIRGLLDELGDNGER